MLVEDCAESNVTSGLPALSAATENWLRRLHESFEYWRQSKESQGVGGDLWQEIMRWYTAFDLSFTQLSQCVDDLTDVEDARLALGESGKSIRIDRIRLLPLARQRLRVIAPDLRKHLLEVHVSRVFAQASLSDEEPIAGMDDLYRIRAHGCRVVYHRADNRPLAPSVTQVAWPHPLRDELQSAGVSSLPSSQEGLATPQTRWKGPAIGSTPPR
jgi:hypothetical protein